MKAEAFDPATWHAHIEQLGFQVYVHAHPGENSWCGLYIAEPDNSGRDDWTEAQREARHEEEMALFRVLRGGQRFPSGWTLNEIALADWLHANGIRQYW